MRTTDYNHDTPFCILQQDLRIFLGCAAAISLSLTSTNVFAQSKYTNTQLVERGNNAWEARNCVQAAKFWFAYLQRANNVSSSLRSNMEKGITWCEKHATISAGSKGDDLGGNPAEPPRPPTIMFMEFGFDRSGKDYNHFPLTKADPGLCQDRCNRENRCRAWTFVKPGVQQERAVCWLKSSVPDRKKSDCCVSGRKVN